MSVVDALELALQQSSDSRRLDLIESRCPRSSPDGPIASIAPTGAGLPGQRIERFMLLFRFKPLLRVLGLFLSLSVAALLSRGPVEAAAADPAGAAPAPPATRPAPVVKVLYVEGTPRWEYRYLKNAMLRQPSVRISCLLTSADLGFTQEGSRADPKIGFPGPLQRFPAKAEELAAFDVLLLGDVDPRQFTDAQLAMIADFVRKGGGLGVAAGPRYTPSAYRKSPLAELLPVNVEKVEPDGKDAQFPDGFQPALTDAGRASPIFRAWREGREAREKGRGAEKDYEPLYWYCRGVTARPAADGAEVLATHPTARADGNPVPLLVIGRCGKGRTLFSGIDDSWRWRFAANDDVFAGYWLEQFRYLAGGKGTDDKVKG
jgi:uncharacterized membrane protein